MQWERVASSTSGVENWISTCKRMKLDLYLTPYTKINSKLMKDLKVIPKTVKLLKENTGEKLLDIYLGNGFLTMTSKAQATKAKIGKWDYIKQKIFRIAKETINRIERQPMEWNKIKPCVIIS